MCRWLAELGATVVAITSSEAKAGLARAAGAHHALGYADMPAGVRALTGGRGAEVVIDGVGKATFDAALDSLARRGLLISFGNASGTVGPVDFAVLAFKGSLFTTRPTLFDYYATPEDFAAGTARVLAMWPRLSVTIGQRYPLSEAARCHADLEARATTGSSLLIP
jgi:NADPH2:quinone reductase